MSVINRSGYVIVRLTDNQIAYGVFDLEKDAIAAAKLLQDPQNYLVARIVPTMLFENCNVIEKRLA